MILRVQQAAAVALLLVLTASLTSAQTYKIAVVDMQLISDQYKELGDRQKELEAWIQEKKALISALQEFMFVSAEEFQEAVRVYQVPKNQWTDVQTKREAELRKISTDNEKRFLDLQAKPSRTAEEQNQFNTDRETAQARERDLTAISRAFEDELKTKTDQVQVKLGGNVRGVIETVAKAKGYTLVLDKRAVFYSVAPVEDMTSEVLKALNTAAGPATAGGGNAGGNKP